MQKTINYFFFFNYFRSMENKNEKINRKLKEIDRKYKIVLLVATVSWVILTGLSLWLILT